jgi:hypothetical protein
MATIKDGSTATQLAVDTVSKAARVSLYDPATGLPMASYIRGTGFDLDTSANVDMRDAIAIAVPGAGGAQIAGVASTPLRTDPTGTTTQPISGTVTVSNLPTTQPISGTVTVANPVGAVQVNNFPANQTVSGTVTVANPISTVAVNNFPVTQQVAGTVGVNGAVSVTNFPGTQTVAGTVNVANLPSTQTVTGNVNATVRQGNVDVSAANPLWVQDQGVTTVNNTAANPVITQAVTSEYGTSFAASIDMQPTTIADGTVFWTMRNASTKTFYIRRIDLHVGFIGTAATSRSTFGIYRFTGTPSGGATGLAVKKISAGASSTSQLLSAAAGLTVTGVTFDSQPFHRITNVNQLNSNGVQSIDFGTNEPGQMQLAPGEGIAIRAVGALVAGCYIAGSTGWHER